MKRHLSLTILGLFLFLVGLGGIVWECWQTHALKIGINYNLCNLVAGIGLLKYWRVARWYSLFMFGSALLMCLPMMVLANLCPEIIVLHFPSILIDDRTHAVASRFVVISTLLIYLAVAGWALMVLLRQDTRAAFRRRS